MSFSFSQPQTSSFLAPNELLDLENVRSAPLVRQNQMLEAQTRQQTVAAGETEQAARIAGTLSDTSLYPTPEARAAAYPTLLAQARANGWRLPHAPDTYPGDDVMRATARMGTPSADLIKLQGTAGAVDAYGNSIGVTGTAGGGAGGGTRPAGGGTATTGDTAPINAAGDSRTRKASEGGPPAPGSPGAAVAKQVHDFWISKGFSEPVVAGIMAGGPGSESDFTPTAGGDKVNGVPTSIGLYQHHGPRLHNAQGTGMLDRYGPNPTADQQNEYAAWEISPQGPLAHVGEMLKTAKTPAEAATIWTQYFGVPADKSEIGRRARGADRFMVYAGQPGAPGASTAPGVVTGDVARPGDIPPPPGGAPGAYGGGGFGAVVGGQPAATRATIPAGRPTGPPVVTDQPAGSNVVAGPPGVATVGAPMPPGPAVPGNVAAISRGIVGAGGQPVTDPNATPTPARYAGTAPAPSVEAAPETGWGSQVGSGYGPQNALAPAPAPAAATPATTAQPATPAAQQPPAPAQQPPAATPAAQAMPPELQTDNSYLTPRDKQQLAPLFDQARRGLIPLTTLQNEVQQRQTFNVQRQKDFLAAQQQQMENARQVEADRRAAETQRLAQITSQREQEAAAALAEQRRIENTRAAETQRLAQEADKRAQAEAAVKAKQAGMPYQGTDLGAQDTNVLMTADPKSQQYAIAYQRMAAPHYNQDGSVVYPNLSAFQKPGYVPPGASEPPDYGAAKVTPPTILTQDQARAGTYADRMTESNAIMSQLDNAAIDYVQKGLSKVGGTVGFGMNSSDYQRVRQAQENFVNSALRLESGAVISEDEFKKASQQYFPQPGDSAAVIAQKKANREAEISGFVREAGPGYKQKVPEAAAPTRIIRYDHTGKRIPE